MTSILQAGLIPGGKERKEGRPTVFFTPFDPFGDEAEEEFNNDLSKPRKVRYYSKWKPHQDAVYWIHLARAQEKGLQFWQTRSHAIVVHDSVPADCIEKVVSMQGDETLYHRLSTPRPAPKIILKDVWILKQQQQQQQDTLSSTGKPVAEQLQGIPTGTPTRIPACTGKRVAEENAFKVDLRIQGIPQDAVREDQGRLTKIQELVKRIDRCRFGEGRKIQQVQRRIKTYNSRSGKY